MLMQSKYITKYGKTLTNIIQLVIMYIYIYMYYIYIYIYIYIHDLLVYEIKSSNLLKLNNLEFQFIALNFS